ncbi:hypothetical protein ACFOSC_27845 [Streptantibioticus rubrisoli]|uniref:Uncharacterized protein n=1 Tax=Streptantibioticus rubrisoli TaxID=1387313 RepID=A0ABT1PKE5_9ACTN|nr:hypothetical protein [Streptantibioticus rubrisoli]MCQ4045835.1 hypothetical protein [Streptantibioticus rubrisoli]
MDLFRRKLRKAGLDADRARKALIAANAVIQSHTPTDGSSHEAEFTMADVRKTARKMFGIRLSTAECIAATKTRLEAMGAVQDEAAGPEEP